MSDLKAPLKLRWLIARLGISHKMLADCVIQRAGRKAGQPLSRTAASRMVTEGWRPSGTPWEEVKAAVEALLAEHRATPEEIASCWEPAAEDGEAAHHPRAHAIPPRHLDAAQPEFDPTEIEREMLNPDTKRHFGIFTDPFLNDIQGPDDIFMAADQRYIREAMYQASKQGGWMIAIVGESGSGKSTLRIETLDRIYRESLPVVVIFPKARDKERLTSRHISEAILREVSPGSRPKSSLEALDNQIDEALIESSRAGYAHVIMIEEAHDLSIDTIKQLKRFWETCDGYRRLLSIVLIGQPELKKKLNERVHLKAREVIRRMEIAELLPLDHNLGEYLAMKLKRVGKALHDVFEPEAVDMLRQILTALYPGQRSNEMVNMCYPLTVNNWTTKAMNQAAKDGASRVTAEIITHQHKLFAQARVL